MWLPGGRKEAGGSQEKLPTHPSGQLGHIPSLKTTKLFHKKRTLRLDAEVPCSECSDQGRHI